MGEVIGARAEASRVEAAIRESLRNARARGEGIAEAGESRLGPAIVEIDAATALRTSATETEAAAWAKVLAEDAKSDTGIGSVRDEMWNAIGRPRQNAALSYVFPDGVTTYTAGNPTEQPVRMGVLSARILSSSAPQWTEALRQGWSGQIEALRAAYHSAVEAHRPAEATLSIAEAGYRSAVRAGHAKLVALKRDLKSLGLSETQIHEVIPDASQKSASSPSGGGTPGEGGA